MQSAADLEETLRNAGLTQWAASLVALAKPCIILVPESADAAPSPVGATRLGGQPDVPPEFEWPLRPAFQPRLNELPGPMPSRVLLGPQHWLHRSLRTQRWKQAKENWKRLCDAELYVRTHDWPLSFVAQIDFAELHAVHALDDFPAAGRLLLFCDAHVWPWGRREHQPRARAVFIEAPSERLQRKAAPEAFNRPEARELRAEGFEFNPRRLRPTAWLLPPPIGSAEFHRLQDEQPAAWGPDGAAFPAYEQFWADRSELAHQVGGVALSIQEPVEAECARFSGAGEQWRLVLQIDSDPVAGMQWGDNGRVYVCARQGDLVARRFDRCWMLMQCY